MKLSETRITTAGVFSCCLASISKDVESEVEGGQERECEYCHERFRLVDDSTGRMPIWRPVRELNEIMERLTV